MKTLIKTVEFAVVVGGLLLGAAINVFDILPALIVAGGYVAVNLLGYANRNWINK